MKEKNQIHTSSFFIGAGAGFALGFIVGAAVIAILDYRDEKLNRLNKLRRDTDENYIYSE